MQTLTTSLRAPSPANPTRYALERELARGGMGIVYVAHDRLVDRKVAYKRLLVRDESTRARSLALFEREYNTLVQLAHPAIVEVYDYGSDERDAYYTMELLSGRDLVELAPMPIGEVCRVLRDVASGLALLHARRIIHRDLSPANVRLTEDGRAKLIDFGALTPFGVAPDLVGTPAFVAPECLAAAALDQRTDLYALGALAYWALTGRVAVHARLLEELPSAWSFPIEPPSTYVPELPQALESLVLSLLSREPLARPASAAEVMERLTAIGNLAPESEEQKVAYSYLAHPPLVGRGMVLAELTTALENVGDQQGACLLLEAASGTGRSELLEHLALQAQLAGVTVLRADGSADAGEFALARGLVRGSLAAHPDLMAIASPRDTQFRQLLGGKRGAGPRAALTPVQASERQALVLAWAQDLLLRASAKNPVAILIDEVQLADSESLALIATLAQEAANNALLLVLTAPLGAPSSDAYRQISAASKRITLENLRESDVQELVNAVFGGVVNSHRVARFLYERSGGNPARCMNLARLLLQRGLIRYTSGTFTLPYDVSPETLADADQAANLTRLATLSNLARDVASFVSLQELALDVAQIATALAAAPREVALALEELMARDVVSMTEGCAAITSHALREVIVGTLAEGQQRALHLQAARALLAAKEGGAELRIQAGIHLLKAGEDVRAAELLTERSEGDWLGGKTPVALLEAVLDVLRRQGRKDEHCLNVLVPLARAGFFGDMGAQSRHLDAALRALSNVCGVTLANKLTPRLGAKFALIAGVIVALFRNALTPKKLRFGTFPETMGALLSTLSATTAAAASALDPTEGLRIVRMFDALRAFGPDSAPNLCMEFCFGTAEYVAAKYAETRERFRKLLERFERPVKGMTEEIHLQFRQGILHTLAQAEVVDTNRVALKLADELERGHMFFAPHAETIRMGYRGYRGEQDLCDAHRRRAEMLALRGGISWTAVTALTVRAAAIGMQTGDAMALVRLIPEFERLSEIAPKLLLYRDAVRAHLELVRGRPAKALELYERLFAQPAASCMITHVTDRAFYARTLSELGRLDEAKQVCVSMLEKLHPDEARWLMRAPIQQLSLIEAKLGDVAGAKGRLETFLADVLQYDNPFWTGALHRDLARVALAAGADASFEEHAAQMSECFHATKNPSLIQQCELLRGEADARYGRRSAPSAFAEELDELMTQIETDESRLTMMTDSARAATTARVIRRSAPRP